MRAIQQSDTFQMLTRSSVEVVGYLLAAALTIVLILAWIVTGPFFQLGARFGRLRKSKQKKTNHPT